MGFPEKRVAPMLRISIFLKLTLPDFQSTTPPHENFPLFFTLIPPPGKFTFFPKILAYSDGIPTTLQFSIDILNRGGGCIQIFSAKVQSSDLEKNLTLTTENKIVSLRKKQHCFGVSFRCVQ